MRPAFLPLDPRPVPRPWGGHRVARRFGWPDAGACGEWWLASSYPGTETPVHGRNLHLGQWLDREGVARGCPAAADFPVLVKFLDADQMLSLQVHPDDAVAARHGLPRGKTEAWFVLDAEPGARAYLGTAAGVGCEQLLDRIEAGAPDEEVRELLHAMAVQPGDTLFVPAGSIHAIGPGLTLYEIQQNSDATYRIHDWGRGRPVHLPQARDAMRDHPPPRPIRRTPAASGWTTLLDEDAFALHRATPNGTLRFTPRGSFATLTVLAGHGQLQLGQQAAELVPGATFLVLDGVDLTGSGLDLLASEPERG